MIIHYSYLQHYLQTPLLNSSWTKVWESTIPMKLILPYHNSQESHWNILPSDSSQTAMPWYTTIRLFYLGILSMSVGVAVAVGRRSGSQLVAILDCAGGAMLQTVWRCRRWAIASVAARLVLFKPVIGIPHFERSNPERILILWLVYNYLAFLWTSSTHTLNSPKYSRLVDSMALLFSQYLVETIQFVPGNHIFY